MFSVVVVEDEPMILNDAIKEIEKADPRFKVTGRATNGRDALLVIDEVKSDVLFTDIRMPVMDGIALITEVRKSQPHLPVVILSGYNEFEYARYAMKLGVQDYLLKPLEEGPLRKVLGEIGEKLTLAISSAERQIIAHGLGGMTDGRNLPGSLSNGRFLLGLINLGNLCGNYLSPDVLGRLNTLWNTLDWAEILGLAGITKWWVIDERHPNQKFIIIPVNENPGLDPESVWGTVLHFICEKVSNVPISIYVEKNELIYSNLWSAAQKIRSSLEKKLVTGRSSLMVLSQKQIVQASLPEIDVADINRLQLLYKSDSSLMKLELLNLLDTWTKAALPQREMENSINRIVMSILGHTHILSEAEISEFEYRLQDKLLLASGIEKISEDLWLLFDSTAPSDCQENEDTKELAVGIEEYIKNNFTLDLSIENIAKKFSFNQSYLTKVFKRYIGETPSKYLINLRINEAKRLMEANPGIEVKTVGELVGYMDSHYFSRIFRNITGKSPSEYKESLR